MYRICLARSGSYYVQRRKGWGWSRVGGFFSSRRDARNWAFLLKEEGWRDGRCCPAPTTVLEYV